MNAHDAIRRAAHDALCGLRIPHADHVWVSPIPFFDEVADAVEAAVSAAGYSITLTDDGVALPVRRDGEGPLAAAPSSPHLEDWTEEERGFVEIALSAADSGNAGHWPTAATYLAAEVRRLRAGEGATPATDRAKLAAVEKLAEDWARVDGYPEWRILGDAARELRNVLNGTCDS